MTEDTEAALLLVLEHTLTGLPPQWAEQARRFRPAMEVTIGELTTHPDLGDRLHQLVTELPGAEFGVYYKMFAGRTRGRLFALAQGTNTVRFRVGPARQAFAADLGAEPDPEYGIEWVKVDAWNVSVPSAQWWDAMRALARTACEFAGGGGAITIRRAASGDANAVAACLRAAFEPYRARYSPEAFNDTVPAVAGVERRIAEMVVFVAIADSGDVVGTISYSLAEGREAHIRGMAVLPSWHGRGVAQQLLAAVESELRVRKCSRITLDTTEPLKRATHFYQQNGFAASGRVTDFFGMPLFEYVKVFTYHPAG